MLRNPKVPKYTEWKQTETNESVDIAKKMRKKKRSN
jgi:hypothetical protein